MKLPRDNEVAESFFGTLKSETVFGEKFKTHTQVKGHFIDYIEMFYQSTTNKKKDLRDILLSPYIFGSGERI